MAYRHMIETTAETLGNLMTNQDEPTEEEISAKIAAEDFAVLVSPEIDEGGGPFRVVLNGLDSLAAAIRVGEEPYIYEATATECDTVDYLERGTVQDFLDSFAGAPEFVRAISRRPW